MPLSIPTHPPKNETQLLERCEAIAGLTFYQLARLVDRTIPLDKLQRKGWLGQAIEHALGADSGSAAHADFPELGIELKTLPLNADGMPAESTFVTSINLLQTLEDTWLTSVCWQKLKRVLWIPVEGQREIHYLDRHIGQGFLWSPDQHQAFILQQDWTEHMDNIVCGRLEDIDARMGEYLQIRPKAADAKSLCYAYDRAGNRIQTLPRGFYLRASFTRQLVRSF